MKIQITNGMYVALLINLVYAKAIGITQGMIAREVGQDMWLATLFATLQGMAMIYLGYIVLRRTPKHDFVELGISLLGRWFGVLISLLMVAFFAGAFFTVMVTFVYHMRDYFLPEMPLYIFVIAAVGIGWYGAYHGLEVMARMAYVGVFFVLLLNGLILVGSFHQIDLENLRPVAETGLPRILWASRHSDADWAIATMATAMILPMVRNPEVRGRSGIAGIAIGGLLVLLWPILETVVLSSEVAQQYIVACMKLARSAHMGHFIQRYEMIMVACFSVSSLLQIMMCLFASAHGVSKAIGWKDYRPMLIPVGLALGGLAYWGVEDHMRAIDLLNVWPYLALPIAFGLPTTLLALRLAMRRKVEKAAATPPPS